MKMLLAAAVLLAMCSCGSSGVASRGREVQYVNKTKFVGDEAFCVVHDKRMKLAPELEGPGADGLPGDFMEQHWQQFPNDGYFYPACSPASGENVWVCPACSRDSARMKGKMGLLP
ncbi:hypothetical protein OJ996_23260 [Luteolibacter sp. GHJ8]|uniref:Secreted protein n=1 Tax=Luteolibacter rhizosphaerae TaxID=2989719 RepID=A0ABT3G9K9_9BACT|nr:hypothetical protein [Luteolibacter rhizosphaerae]MCW1916525.1 hypothetical protein [Luteolibacter rhizosphaerae]